MSELRPHVFTADHNKVLTVWKARFAFNGLKTFIHPQLTDCTDTHVDHYSLIWLQTWTRVVREIDTWTAKDWIKADRWRLTTKACVPNTHGRADDVNTHREVTCTCNLTEAACVTPQPFHLQTADTGEAAQHKTELWSGCNSASLSELWSNFTRFYTQAWFQKHLNTHTFHT